jgi:type I restriction enzyme S subunit
MVPESEKFQTFIYSHHLLKAFVKKEGFLPEYLYNLYRVKKYRDKAAYGDAGSTVRALPSVVLEEQIVPLPDVETQESINEVISLIDQQIENNKSLAKNLEALAQSIFRSWFVDFEPVHAKARGEKPFGMDDETAALFPDSFEESESGLIPAGWELSLMKNLCVQVVNGSTPYRRNSSYWDSGDIPWFKTGELSDNFLINADEGITDLALKETSVKLLPKGSILMAIYASPTVGRLGILTKDSTFNQACTGMVPRDEVGKEFLFLTLQANRQYFNEMASGAAQQNISKQIVEDCPIFLPSDALLAKCKELFAPIFSEIEQLNLINNDLKNLENVLLPSLIDGNLNTSKLDIS